MQEARALLHGLHAYVILYFMYASALDNSFRCRIHLL